MGKKDKKNKGGGGGEPDMLPPPMDEPPMDLQLPPPEGDIGPPPGGFPDDGIGPPPDDMGPPPGDMAPPPGDDPVLEEWRAHVAQTQQGVDECTAELEQARGTPGEAELEAELHQELMPALEDANAGLAEYQQHAAGDPTHVGTTDEAPPADHEAPAEPPAEPANGGPPATTSGWGHMRAANDAGNSSFGQPGLMGLVAQNKQREFFDHFDQGAKGHMDRADLTDSVHYLGYDCDDDYCTQLLATFALAAEIMDRASFTKMWEHLGADATPLPPGPPPTPRPAEDAPPAAEAPAADAAADAAHMEEWRQQRLTELKAAEEERLQEEAVKHARTVLHAEDDLAHMLRDEDILRALFTRIDPGSTGRTSRGQWLTFLAADEGILTVMKLQGLERSALNALFEKWPTTGITFPGFVALLRAQFGRALGIEYHYHDEVKKVQELEAKLHEEMQTREADTAAADKAAAEAERERIREEVIDEMRQQQVQQLVEIRAEVAVKLAAEKDLESQSLLEAEMAEVDTAMMGLESLSAWPERIRELEQARAERAEALKNKQLAMTGRAIAGEEAALAAAGWFTAQDQTGRLYYYNAATRWTTWQPPAVAPLPAPPPPPPAGHEEGIYAGNASPRAAIGQMLPGAGGGGAPVAPPPPTLAAESPGGAGVSTSDLREKLAAGASPQDLLMEIQMAGAMRNADEGLTEVGEPDERAAAGSIPQIPGVSGGGFGLAAELIEAEAHGSPASPVRTMLAASSLASASVNGGKESIADRSRRLREARGNEVGASVIAPAPGPISFADEAGEGEAAPAAAAAVAQPTTVGAALASKSGAVGFRAGSAGTAPNRTGGLLAARRAKRQAEQQQQGPPPATGSLAARVGARSAMMVAGEPLQVLSTARERQPSLAAPPTGSMLQVSGDAQPTWQQSPRGVGRSTRRLAPGAVGTAAPVGSVAYEYAPYAAAAPAPVQAQASSPVARLAAAPLASSLREGRPPASTRAEAPAAAAGPPPWAATTRRVVTGGKQGSTSTPWAKTNKPSTMSRTPAAPVQRNGGSLAAVSGGAAAADAPWKRR